MNNLPAELKQQICGLLDSEDLNSIRVVNKTWAYIAALHLFKEITITPLSLERLKLIAKHEVIATCVTSITFRVDLLPSILPEMWQEELIRRCRTWTMGEEHLQFHRYVRAYREQQRLRENSHKLSREIIDLSNPMLRRLQRLKLATGGDRRLSLPIENISHPNQQWYEVLYDLKSHDVLDERGASRRDTEISKQFTNLLNALATSGVHIQKLSIMSVSEGVWQRGLQLLQQPYCAGLTTLRTVFLGPSDLFRHSHGTADGHCGVKALSILLEEAQGLQTLKLHGTAGPYCRAQTDFLRCFRPSLPKLSRLCLYGITATEEDLIDTLLAYRTTLASLDVKMVLLKAGQSTGSWHQIFRRVPEILPCLLEIRLGFLYYNVPGPGSRWQRSQRELEPPYLEAVEHAIMNGTDIPQLT